MIATLIRKTGRKISKNIAPLGYALATFLICALILGALLQAEQKRVEALRRSDAVSFGSMMMSQVGRELNAVLFISGGLASYLNVYRDELEPRKIYAILADLYARSRHVRNLAIAVGYRLTYVYPVRGNEKAIGMDYRDLPQQWPKVKQAIETHQGVLAGPLDLVQGGNGLIYRYPVYIDGKYWGLLSTVIDTRPFLQSAFGKLRNPDYDFAIRTREAAGQPGQAFYGRPELFDHPGAHIMTSDVPNGTWEWAILRKQERPSHAIQLIQGMGIAISLLLSSVVYFFLRERTELAAHAMYDSLTGLANRRLLQDRMDQALTQAQRFRRAMAIMYLDIDHFKQLNDNFGHDFGDELLKSVARRLAECIRNVDTLSRVGGDEFVIVLEEIQQPEDARLVAESILLAFEEPFQILGVDIQARVSIGVAIYQPGQATSAKELLKQADLALYEAKYAGRNRYQVSGKTG